MNQSDLTQAIRELTTELRGLRGMTERVALAILDQPRSRVALAQLTSPDLPAAPSESKPSRSWMLTNDAAAYCGISPNALRKHIALGHLVPDSWGGRGRMRTHRFKQQTLDRFLAGPDIDRRR